MFFYLEVSLSWGHHHNTVNYFYFMGGMGDAWHHHSRQIGHLVCLWLWQSGKQLGKLFSAIMTVSSILEMGNHSLLLVCFFQSQDSNFSHFLSPRVTKRNIKDIERILKCLSKRTIDHRLSKDYFHSCFLKKNHKTPTGSATVLTSLRHQTLLSWAPSLSTSGTFTIVHFQTLHHHWEEALKWKPVRWQLLIDSSFS